jgi:hypothetical protein
LSRVALGAAMMKCAEAGLAIAPLTHAYGRCYPTGTVPRQFQDRPKYYRRGY